MKFLTRQGLNYFLGLASFKMLAMFRRGLFYAYLSIYLRHYLGMRVTETTLFATLPMLLNVLAQTFIWGRISDRFQLRRSLIVCGELLGAAGTVAVWYLHRLPVTPIASGYAIIIGLTVIELFWSMSNIAWSALVADLYDDQDRSKIQGRLSSMGGLGRMAGIWVGGMLYDGLGLRFAGWGFYAGPLFFVSAGIMLISTIPLLFLPEGGVAVSQNGMPDAITDPTVPKNSTARFLVFLLGMIFVNFGRNSIALTFPQYLALDSGLALDSRIISYIINTQSLAIVLLGWFAGRWGRKFGNDVILLIGSLTAIAALAVLTCSTALAWLCLGSFLRGAADVVVLATAYAYAAALIPSDLRARRFAWFNATFFLSWGLSGTIFSGPLVDALIRSGKPQSWAYRISFAAAAGVTTIGLCILALLIRFQRRFPATNNWINPAQER